MTQVNRLAGGQVDRTKELSFKFDGKSYRGYQGDTPVSYTHLTLPTNREV